VETYDPSLTTSSGHPENIEFDTDELIDAAVDVCFGTIRDPRQFELTLEDLRRRAGLGRLAIGHLGGIASNAAERIRLD
jgi:hypothetical protein